MKTAIKLVFIYLVINILASLLLLIPYSIYLWATGGDILNAQTAVFVPSFFLNILLMVGYLWQFGYISREKVTWSIVSLPYLALTLVAALSSIWILDVLLSYLYLPDLMKETFDILQSGWLGIFSIVVAGPILEELLFRGAITKVLLQKYSPTKAILFSALIFGVIHVNPAQVVGACIIGLFLAWIYYKTGSLIPCILIHIVNNSLSVYLSLHYPDIENLAQAMNLSDQSYWLLTLLMVVLFVGSYLLIRRTTIVHLPTMDGSKQSVKNSLPTDDILGFKEGKK